jgi:phenylpropionate dioxygenase-like ring-hydroxylating dioxygenase large terminal subunit
MQRRGAPVRVPKDRYVSPEVHRREVERLWPKVWQIACRTDDVPEPGSYIEYTIADQSILVLRDDDGRVRAFHNVCLHRGNLLAPGSGRVRRLVCGFHCWSWNLDGSLHRATYAERFGDIDPEAYHLRPIRVGEWGGFVFVCLADEAPDLLEWLGPIPAQLAPYHLERHTRTQDYSLLIQANWKTVADAFLESYHVQGVHPQLLPFLDDTTTVYECLGPHSRMLIPVGRPSGLLRAVTNRQIFSSMVRNASGSDTELDHAPDKPAVVDALAAMELPAGFTVRDWLVQATRAQAEEQGIDLTGLSDDQVAGDWHYHLFPNTILNVYAGAFWLFRLRPHGDDPNWMRFDFQDYHWLPDPKEVRRRRAVHRFVEPGTVSLGEVMDQDLAMLPKIQQGLRSRGISELTLSSMEVRIANMHRVLDGFLG